MHRPVQEIFFNCEKLALPRPQAEQNCKKIMKKPGRGNSPDLPVTVDNVLVAAKLLQPHGSPGVQLLGRDAHLTAQTKLAAVGKAGGAVHIHSGAVYRSGEPVGVCLRPGQDGLAVAGGVLCDVGNGLIYTVHHLDGKDIVQKLGVKVRRTGRCAGNDGGGACVQPQLYRQLARSHAVGAKTLRELWQKLLRNGRVHQTHLLGVAHGGAAGFGVNNDLHRLVQIGVFVHIHMADTGTGLDTGNGGVLHTAADQARPATGDQKIHQPVGPHQIGGALVAGVVHDVDDLRIPSGGGIGAIEHHSESPEAYFAHTPGLKVVSCANANDAYWMIQQAIQSDDPVVFLEPKRRYHVKDLVNFTSRPAPMHQAAITRYGTDATLLCYGPMVKTCLDAAAVAAEEGTSLEVVDLRTISPIDWVTIQSSVRRTKRAIVVHEAPKTLGIGSEIAAKLHEDLFYVMESPVMRVAGYDMPYPPARVEGEYLPSVDRILDTVDQSLAY